MYLNAGKLIFSNDIYIQANPSNHAYSRYASNLFISRVADFLVLPRY